MTSSHLLVFNIPTSDEPYTCVELHPFVTLSILDHHLRRDNSIDRVIGALLGSIDEGVVTVKNCFPVPHKDEKEIAVDMDFYRNMLRLHNQVYSNERIVGWYSTGIKESSLLLHNFFMKEMNASPVHIIVDPIVDPNVNGNMKVHCYYGSSIELGNLKDIHLFKPLKFVYKTDLQDRITLESFLKRGKGNNDLPLNNIQSITELIQEILGMLENVQQYIQNVISGDQVGSYNIGIMLEELLSLLPSNETEFKKIFSSGIQDILMIAYLSNLSKKQLQIAEQLRESIMTGDVTQEQQSN
jgi:translation initiation factor 3 subunit F